MPRMPPITFSAVTFPTSFPPWFFFNAFNRSCSARRTGQAAQMLPAVARKFV
jgi:hypothetical protein